ncbi:hypothetical protein HMPREF7545_0871 [Selenomonas noxia ATCC 43541]|nr:hypothetical protein HMPREF7545_0871 [Selenomonas noxia ATCC 43541]
MILWTQKRECPHGHSLFVADEMSKAPKRILVEQVSKVCVLPQRISFVRA